jgi:hypothetical protein
LTVPLETEICDEVEHDNGNQQDDEPAGSSQNQGAVHGPSLIIRCIDY